MFETVPLSLHHFFTLEISFLQRIEIILFFKIKEEKKRKRKRKRKESGVTRVYLPPKRLPKISGDRNKKKQKKSTFLFNTPVTKKSLSFCSTKDKIWIFSNFKKSLLGAFTFS
jgi:hypothetical protein